MYLSRFLIRFEHEARLLEYGGDSPHIEPLVQPRHFDLALKKGFMEMAGEIIATTGVSLPLDHLVEKSGIKEVKKPKVCQRIPAVRRCAIVGSTVVNIEYADYCAQYYQGLMLYGKHKIEWVRERESGPRRHQNRISEESPIITIAGHANLAAIE